MFYQFDLDEVMKPFNTAKDDTVSKLDFIVQIQKKFASELSLEDVKTFADECPRIKQREVRIYYKKISSEIKKLIS